jgi:carbamoyltransferase
VENPFSRSRGDTAVLGINAVFHDSAAALVVGGEVVAAAEEERFSRRKHGKPPVAFSTWEPPEQAAAWCLREAGLRPHDLAAVAYSYDPALADPDATGDPWEQLRTMYVERAPGFLATALRGLDAERVRFVPHHVAHAASAYHGAGFPSCAVLVLDGRGEAASHLAGHYRDGQLEVLAAQRLPSSLGLLYEELTEHLGFRRSSDEYKVMAMGSYGRPVHLEEFRRLIRADGEGGFVTEPVEWERFAPGLADGEREAFSRAHADLAATVQRRLEEILLSLAGWLAERTGERRLTMAGGVALNCVANSRLASESAFERIWVQPAAGDSGTALGAATHVSERLGVPPRPMRSAALGRSWTDEELEARLTSAAVPFERCRDIALAVAERLAGDAVVAWHQGRSEWGPRALGHRSLLADPRRVDNLERLNDIKGREQFRPVAPMVLESRAGEVFEGVLPSPYMLFTHRVRPGWESRIPAVVHVDGTARIQTVDGAEEPLVARMLARFEQLTGVPVVVNTSLNTAGRPMVDDPRDALECFGSAPIDFLAIGPFLVSRGRFLGGRARASEEAPVAGVG